MDNPNKLAT